MAEVNDATSVSTRPRKSAADKAQADYDAAVKTRDVAKRKLDKLKEGMEPAQAAFDAAERRVAYLGQNPDLPQQDADAAQSGDEAGTESHEES